MLNCNLNRVTWGCRAGKLSELDRWRFSYHEMCVVRVQIGSQTHSPSCHYSIPCVVEPHYNRERMLSMEVYWGDNPQSFWMTMVGTLEMIIGHELSLGVRCRVVTNVIGPTWSPCPPWLTTSNFQLVRAFHCVVVKCVLPTIIQNQSG